MIVLDYRDRRPLYEQVTEKLEELMFSGVLPSDSRLPSVRSMATELSISQYYTESLRRIRTPGIYLFHSGKRKFCFRWKISCRGDTQGLEKTV